MRTLKLVGNAIGVAVFTAAMWFIVALVGDVIQYGI